MTLDEINETLPEHDKTSCDDNDLANKGFSLSNGIIWCRRCTALWILKLEEQSKDEK